MIKDTLDDPIWVHPMDITEVEDKEVLNNKKKVISNYLLWLKFEGAYCAAICKLWKDTYVKPKK